MSTPTPSTSPTSLPIDTITIILAKLLEEPTAASLSKLLSTVPTALRMFKTYHKSLLDSAIKKRKRNLRYLLDPGPNGANYGWYRKEEFEEVAGVSREITVWTEYRGKWVGDLVVRERGGEGGHPTLRSQVRGLED